MYIGHGDIWGDIWISTYVELMADQTVCLIVDHQVSCRVLGIRERAATAAGAHVSMDLERAWQGRLSRERECKPTSFIHDHPSHT